MYGLVCLFRFFFHPFCVYSAIVVVAFVISVQVSCPSNLSLRVEPLPVMNVTSCPILSIFFFFFFFIAYGVRVFVCVAYTAHATSIFYSTRKSANKKNCIRRKKKLLPCSQTRSSYNHESMCASHIYIYLYYLYSSYRLPLSQNLLCFSFCCWLRLTMTTIRYTHSM